MREIENIPPSDFSGASVPIFYENVAIGISIPDGMSGTGNYRFIQFKNLSVGRSRDALPAAKVSSGDKLVGRINGMELDLDGSRVKKIYTTMDVVDVEWHKSRKLMKEFETKSAHWDHCLSLRTVEGLILEFGVFNGTSINHIADQVAPHKVYGFDSFKGLPRGWYKVRKGYFALPEPPIVRDNVELVVGLFEDTLPEFLSKHPEPASLVHVDCDLYDSTKTVLDNLRSRIVPGTVIIFDEFNDYGAWHLHEYKAFSEFMETSTLKHEYIAQLRSCDNPRPVSVRIL